ncbi:condensation domain-containing protein [Amycolatopsis decaplanina]
MPLVRLRQLAASYRGFARVLAEAAEHLPEGRWSPAQRALLGMLGSLAVLADAGIEPALLLTHGLGGAAARVPHSETVGMALDAVAESAALVEPPDAAALSSVLPSDCTVVDLTPGTALSDLLPAAIPFAEALCRLHLQGRTLNWQAVIGRPRQRIELPVAPLSEEHCWPLIAHPQKESVEPEAPQPLLGSIDDIVLEMACDVLGEPGLALTDEFLGIGGNSLNGTQLIALINERFDVDLDVLDLFELPDLQAFANAVAAAAPEFSPAKTDTRSASECPLSEQQMAVLAAMGSSQEPRAWNRPAALLLDGDTDPDALAELLTCLVRKHSMLRASLRDTPDGPRQVIAPPETAKAELESAELVIAGETELDRRRELLDQVNRMAAVPVSPYADPPVRYQLIDAYFPDRTRQILLVVFHRLFVDEWGWHKVFEELIEGPAATPAPQRQYFDYVHAQRQLLSDGAESLTAFWTGYLAGSRYTPLPADASYESGQPPVVSASTDLQLTIPAGTADALREFARRERGTLHMVMLAAWVAFLWDISKEPEVTVAVMAAGRAPEDESLVGNFANTLVLRAGVRSDESFSELLAVVREMTLLTFSHQHLPADRIGRIVKRGVKPLASTMFTFSGTPVGPASRLGDDGPGVELLELTPVSSSSPLSLTVLVHSQEVHLNLQFSEELFTRETVQAWLKNYSALLRRVALLGHGIAVSDLVNSGIAERVLIAPRADSDQATRDSQGAGAHLSPRHR